MPAKTIGAGLLLVAVGAIVSILSESESITSWIPAMVGAVFILFGLVALFKDDWRRHLMHATAAIALLMVIATLGRVISAGTSGWAAVSQVALVVVCVGYVGAAWTSFREAAATRRAAKKAGV